MKKWWIGGFIGAVAYIVLWIFFFSNLFSDVTGRLTWKLIGVFSGGWILYFLIGAAIGYFHIEKFKNIPYWIWYGLVFLVLMLLLPVIVGLFAVGGIGDFGSVLPILFMLAGVMPLFIFGIKNMETSIIAGVIPFALMTYAWIYLEVFSKINAKWIKKIFLAIVLILMLVGMLGCILLDGQSL